MVVVVRYCSINSSNPWPMNTAWFYRIFGTHFQCPKTLQLHRTAMVHVHRPLQNLSTKAALTEAELAKAARATASAKAGGIQWKGRTAVAGVHLHV